MTMSYSLSGTGVRGLLLDVEGTTTPIDFVYGVLFPFARARVADFLKRRSASAEVRSDLELLKAENEQDVSYGLKPPAWPETTSGDALIAGRENAHGIGASIGAAGPSPSSGSPLTSASAGPAGRASDSRGIGPASGGPVSPQPLHPLPEESIEPVTAYVHWLMDQDRKSPGLKSLQGKIWQQGYLDGSLKGRVFPDVPPAMKEWHARAFDVRIFSSGSVLAQKLLFSRSEAGDLTRYLRGHFDTATGPKTSDESYRRIATEVGLPPSTLLFISDVVDELDAAHAAGLRTLLCVRPGNRPQTPGDHPLVKSFDQIAP